MRVLSLAEMAFLCYYHVFPQRPLFKMPRKAVLKVNPILSKAKSEFRADASFVEISVVGRMQHIYRTSSINNNTIAVT